MAAGGYKIWNQYAAHFITFAVVEWVDVFTRIAYRDIVLDSIRYCQAEKGFIVYGWCLMSNHVHMIAAAKNEDLSGVLGSFKKHTSKQLLKAINSNLEESRRTWMLDIFKQAGTNNSRNENYQFWQQDNHPMECFSKDFTRQKLEYIHNNPVEAGIVTKPEEYLYSSARDYYNTGKGLLDIELLIL